MQQQGWILLNGQLPTWRKSVDGLNDVLRAAGAAATLDELDAVTEAFAAACQSGALSGVEADLGVRALGRALRRLSPGEGPGAAAGDGAASGAGPAEHKVGGGLEYGAAVPGVRLLR